MHQHRYHTLDKRYEYSKIFIFIMEMSHDSSHTIDQHIVDTMIESIIIINKIQPNLCIDRLISMSVSVCMCLTLPIKYSKVDAGTAQQRDNKKPDLNLRYVTICKILPLLPTAQTGYYLFHCDFITVFIQSLLQYWSRVCVCV